MNIIFMTNQKYDIMSLIDKMSYIGVRVFMKQRYIYLVFSMTGTWLSQLIYVCSNIEHPHSSISFDDSFTEMYSFGRVNPRNPFSGGFVVENLHEGVYKNSPNCKCLIYKIKVSEAEYCLLQEQVKEFLMKKEEYRYNFIGLLGVMLNKPLKRKNHYFCSQFISEILIKSGVFHSYKAPELISTAELLSIKNKEIVYEGSIALYKHF